MALVLGSIGGLGLAWLVSKSSRWETKAEEKPCARTTVMNGWKSTGVYNDISKVSLMLGHNLKGFFVSEQRGHDLSGAPCRWIEDRNGAVYKTYDMHTEYVY